MPYGPLLRIATVFCLVAACTPARADRDIVFSAEWYRYTGQRREGEPTVEARGSAHLYRINPDGGGLMRVTHTPGFDDVFPKWSPDGRSIAFWQWEHATERNTRLCTVPANGGPVRTLAKFARGANTRSRCDWSRDGRYIAAEAPRGGVLVVNLATGHKTMLTDAYAYSWAPSGHRLFLCYAPQDGEFGVRQENRIYDAATGRFAAVANPIIRPCWLMADTIVGVAPFDHERGRPRLRVIDHVGAIRKELPLGDGKDEDITWTSRGYWLPGKSEPVIYEELATQSDGPRYHSYIVDITTGEVDYISEGMFAGISPDGRFVARADWEWVGPYKRGGERLGALEIQSLDTGKREAITSGLVQIYGGDWRRGGR